MVIAKPEYPGSNDDSDDAHLANHPQRSDSPAETQPGEHVVITPQTAGSAGSSHTSDSSQES